MEGWVKMHRSFLNWEWFDDVNMVKLFIYLILSANHKDGYHKGTLIKRGQLKTGLDSLSKSSNISLQTVKTCLKRLEKTQEINQQTNNQFRIITICNYDSYQGVDETANKQTNKQLTSNQQATNSKQECKKERKKENIYRRFAHLSISVDANKKLIDLGYSQEQIESTYDSIENYKKNTQYKSLFLTAKKWLQKEYGKPERVEAPKKTNVPQYKVRYIGDPKEYIHTQEEIDVYLHRPNTAIRTKMAI